MDNFFGGKDPFDHPFFTQPFGGLFGGKSPFDAPFFTNTFDDLSVSRKQITIEELNPEDDGGHNALQDNKPSKKVFLTEIQEEDKTVGQSLHTISNGMHDKGHSVAIKQFPDGKVDSMQTLHNLQEDELTGFQENWKMKADKVLPGCNDGFNLIENTAVNKNRNAWDDLLSWPGWGGWPSISFETRNYRAQSDDDESQRPSSHGSSKKIVPVE
ncbi:hypothetical protein DH2020_025257 [Rehmannia glutinosa]|uniref:Uncharacterized protein n=1 Tax=Rehmannia glutinosa TaxID=99300 RepID=A0ABR0W0B9_REHGL